ncbi:MAG: carboxymuconolactone decarboxylase family protein, partial [Patescibacteria group bacterium]
MKFIIICLCFSVFIVAHAMDKEMMSTKADVKMTYQDIQKTLGIVPSFMKLYPEMGISAAWEEYRSVFINPDTALSGKLKQLIVAGIAAQTPSEECSYMSTEFAKLNGAKENEIKEAVAIAAATRHWSTFLNGVQYDEAQFRTETNNIISYVKKEMDRTEKKPEMEKEKSIVVTDAQSAYQDIKQTLGSVPRFFQMLPEDTVAGAWKMMKSIQLNPKTAL